MRWPEWHEIGQEKMPMYQLTDVTKLYGKGRRTVPAVRDLSLAIGDGEWLAIQGRTGHGKSTLLNLLGVLDQPTSGKIEFDGRDLTRLHEARASRLRAESIGFVFQTFNLVPTLSAAENVEAALIPLRAGPGDGAGDGRARRSRWPQPTGPRSCPARWRAGSRSAARSP